MVKIPDWKKSNRHPNQKINTQTGWFYVVVVMVCKKTAKKQQIQPKGDSL